MSAPSKQVLASASVRPREGEDTDRIQVQVLGEATANPHLIIAPCVDQDAAFTGRYMILHLPTGYAVIIDDAPWKLRPIVAAITDLDWGSVTTADGFANTEIAKTAGAAIKSARLTEPTAAELPAHDIWGKDGKGKGLKRAAVPLAEGMLADYRAACKLTGGGDDSIPFRLDDGGGRDGQGSFNQEWGSAIMRQCHVFGLAYLLLALNQLDPEVADSASAFLADAWEAGDSIGEWAWEFGQDIAKGDTPKVPGIPEQQVILTAI